LRSRGEPFSFLTQASVNLGQDPEMIDLMTAANLREVFIGIESPDENVLQTSHKYHNIKNPLVESVNNLKKNGMTVMGSFRVAAARNAAATGANLQTAPVPGWSGDKPSPARLAGQTLTIGANTKNADGAWAFIQYYLSPAAQLEFAKAGVMPSRVSAYGDKFFKEDPAAKDMQAWTDYAKQHGRMEKTPKDFSKLSEEIAKAIQKVVLQNADPKAALDEAAAAYNAQRS